MKLWKFDVSSKKTIAWTLIFCIVIKVVYFMFCEILLTWDSYDYIGSAGFGWLTGNIDRYRLPLYPMLIDIFSGLGNPLSLYAVAYLQLILSSLSVLFFYKLLRLLGCRIFLCLIVTLYYAICPAIIGWEKTMLTESLSLTFTVFICYNFVAYLNKRGKKYALLTIAVLTLASFLKAVFAVYTGLLLSFFIFRFVFPFIKDTASRQVQRKNDAWGILFCIIPVTLLIAYAACFNRLYGGWTISDSGLGQQLTVIANDTDYYKQGGNPEIIKMIDSLKTHPARCTIKSQTKRLKKELEKSWCLTDIDDTHIESFLYDLGERKGFMDSKLEAERVKIITENGKHPSRATSCGCIRDNIIDSFPRKKITSFVKNAYLENIPSNIVRIIKNCKGSYINYSSSKTTLSKIVRKLPVLTNLVIPCSMPISVLIGLTGLFMLLAWYWFRKNINWILLTSSSLVLITVMFALIGTNGEFPRTALTAVPVQIILTSYIAEIILRHTKIERVHLA